MHAISGVDFEDDPMMETPIARLSTPDHFRKLMRLATGISQARKESSSASAFFNIKGEYFDHPGHDRVAIALRSSYSYDELIDLFPNDFRP